ncbi:CENP-V/GFA domain-containing protein [Plasmodiophora brassicae]
MTRRPMLLEGSCHCGRVSIRMESRAPYPFCICHCHADTKTAGAMNCNIRAQASSLVVKGEEHVRVYQAEYDGVPSSHKRHFCQHCASYLWAADELWPEWIYPFASCIDTPLPAVRPEDQRHIMTDYKLSHVTIPDDVPPSNRFPEYPVTSLEEWHRERGWYLG